MQTNSSILGGPDWRDTIDVVQKMRALLEDFCAGAQKHGYEIRPYTLNSLPHFIKLEHSIQLGIFQNFSRYCKVLRDAEMNGISWKDNKQIVWRMISELGLRPPSNLFSKFDDAEVIEIYDSRFVQVFRNLAFFEVCSYSIEELFCFEWTQLYKRPQSATDQLIELCTKVFKGEIREAVHSGVPDHLLHEIFSTRQNIIKMEQRWISPLFDETGTPAGVVGTTKCKVLSKNSSVSPSQNSETSPIL